MFQAKNENEKIVLNFFEALTSGDLAQLKPFFTEDFVWEPMFTGTGVKEERGLDIIENFFKPVLEFLKLESMSIKVNLVISEGDTVVCELANKGELKDGRPYSDHCCWVITLHAGKMTRVREYLDSHYISELMRPENIGA